MFTDKQERFCQEYVKSGNKTEAFLLAGYAGERGSQAVKVNACKLSKNPGVIARIEEIRREARAGAEEDDITIERIIREYAQIAFFDIKELFDDSGEQIDIRSLPSKITRAVQSIESFGGKKTVKMHDKLKALDALSRLLELNPPERVSVDVTDKAGLARRLAYILARGAMDSTTDIDTEGE